MSRIRVAALTFAGIALQACAPTPQAVPVVGESCDTARLCGAWVGEYSSVATARSGSIAFELAVDSDTAYGDVVMIPRGRDRPIRPAEGYSGMKHAAPDVLRIAFVRVQGQRISGALTPYRDPECGCILHTTFSGVLEDDVIKGTFVSRTEATGATYRGSWKVRRRKSDGTP